MTIRYSCVTCGVVMKIKDDKAGTEAKCPKCKTKFTVPSPEDEVDPDMELEIEDEADGEAPVKTKAARKPLDDDSDDDIPVKPKLPKVRLPDPPLAGDDEDSSDEPSGKPAKIKLPRVRLPDPEPDDDDDDLLATPKSRKSSSKADAPASINDDDDVDEPIGLTPSTLESDDFDRIEAPVSKPVSRPRTSSPTAGGGDHRANVADLMRDFGSSAARETRGGESPRPIAPSPMATSGSAADALARAYQAKKDSSSQSAKPKKKGEINEQRELFVEWIVKIAPGLVVVLALAYGVYSWMTSRTFNGPPLAPVAGILTRNGSPIGDYRICLVPEASSSNDPSAEDMRRQRDESVGKSTATGFSNAEGRFTMMYTAEVAGVALGAHRLEVFDQRGQMVRVPAELVTQTIKEEGIEELKIDLK